MHLRKSLRSLSATLLCLGTLGATAQQKKQSFHRLFPKHIPEYAINGQAAGATAPDYLARTYGLGSGYIFRSTDTRQDHLGMTHRRYVEYFSGYPVEGSMIISHEQNNMVKSINGDAFMITAANATPAISASVALTKALDYIKAEKYIWQQEADKVHGEKLARQPEGEIVWAPAGSLSKGKEFRLAYRFDIYALKPLKRSYVYVDAINGDILWERSMLQNEHVTGTAQTMYSGTRTMTTDSVSPGDYILYDETRGLGMNTRDLNHDMSYVTSEDFRDTDNLWNTTTDNDHAANDVHWGMQQTYDYFLATHSLNSFNGSGAAMYSFVHFYIDFANAFWDGFGWAYGDGVAGDPDFPTPFTSLEIVGHEFTHAVTQYSAGLVYEYESGALNESFSDIFATAIEFEVKPATAQWRIGNEITPSGEGFRNMADPNEFESPDTYNGTYWSDDADVHYNSAVQNFWFYILTNGKTGTNDLGNSYSVSGIGMNKAADIAFRMLTVYLTPSSGYTEAREASILAASDLYGGCSDEVIQVTNAWYAVGVGNAYTPVTYPVNFHADHVIRCALPAPVTFTNATAGVESMKWYFGDGSSSEESNPTHTYTANGNYNVKLVVTFCDGSKDSLTKTAFIKVNTASNACDTTIMTATATTVNQCYGIVLDPGGASADYPDNMMSTLTLTTEGDYFKYRFLKFSTEEEYDFLYMFDGINATAPAIGTFTGSAIPFGGAWQTSTGPALHIRFTSDEWMSDQGYVIEYECIDTTTTPPAGINDRNTLSMLKVFPNPATEFISIQGNMHAMEKIQLQLTNSLGQVVRSFPATADASGFINKTIDIKGLAPGIYTLQLQSNRGTETRKIFIR